MAVEVVLENFSGPLDLLLHLVRKQEVDIREISISDITEQYLSYLRTMEELSLEIASEFVVMAATLLAIKSRMLLPRPQPAKEEVPEEDPREALIAQLMAYQRVKWAAEELRARYAARSLVYARDPLDLSPYRAQPAPSLTGVTLWDLLDAYRRWMARRPKPEPVAAMRGHVVSVEEMMERMIRLLRRAGRLPFYALLRSAHSRSEIVSGFLALLELMKAQVVRCLQPHPFGEIEVVLAETAGCVV
ncbi:segregation and condensation protein A [Alicyclobacillus cellulosilyticus]|uniref:Segregation and condensation protein A n=1 Tax=Alicyclobacillus cellulosilyticus TaxID=1003997 RepID=A0A917NEW4_9BACL|nr:segregation/condensation protein A [Alicyclobacillus cellulosilyticus]GGI95545.1 segregation and condensation protein A [Alicyclobacillus cellulosilyticus]